MPSSWRCCRRSAGRQLIICEEYRGRIEPTLSTKWWLVPSSVIVRLIERGKADLAFAGPLARYGACQYLDGRRIGNRLNGHDVTSAYCRRKKGVSVERLDRFDDPNDEWQELVVEDRHSGPADVASTRIDFRAWLESLPERTQRVAEVLATGEATSHVAQMFGCLGIEGQPATSRVA